MEGDGFGGCLLFFFLICGKENGLDMPFILYKHLNAFIVLVYSINVIYQSYLPYYRETL